MKSNKYKVRISLLIEDEDTKLIAVALYRQRRDRPLVFLGRVSEDGLFQIEKCNTFSMSARDWLAKELRFNKWGINKIMYELAGAVRLEERTLHYVKEISQNSFMPNTLYPPKINPLHPMLLIEYIKQNAKFYGKKEKVFGDGGTQSSQD